MGGSTRKRDTSRELPDDLRRRLVENMNALQAEVADLRRAQQEDGRAVRDLLNRLVEQSGKEYRRASKTNGPCGFSC